MTKSIKLSESDWATLHDRIKKDYPKSVWLIRDKMRCVLGFVPREHQEWLQSYDDASPEDKKLGKYGYRDTIYLDFYDDKKKTMFVMKYSEYLNG
jgi:hypothetical protein